MATAEAATRPHTPQLTTALMKDRHSRRHPFSSWVKRLTNLKPSSDQSPREKEKQNTSPKGKKPFSRNASHHLNNPYPLSGHIQHHDETSTNGNGSNRLTFSTPPSRSETSFSLSHQSLPASADDRAPPTTGNKSCAPTLATNADTVQSEAGRSKTGTSATIGISSRGGGEGSTFSSPAPSERSLTTTLTTVQSAAVSALLPPQPNTPHGQQTVQFTHQFPVSPASAVPPHLAPHGSHPMTYHTATANNLLTDNASIMTLASSSKRNRRRNSLDTNASIRALAPSSIFGGSHESLPLSTLSGIAPDTTSPAGRSVLSGFPSAERTSVYSASGAVPTLSSERNSYYAAKQASLRDYGDGASVTSGLHGRNDSITENGYVTSLTSRDQGRMSRRSSAREDVNGREASVDGMLDIERGKERKKDSV